MAGGNAGSTAATQKKQHTEHVPATSTTPTGLSEQHQQAGASATLAELSQQCSASVHSSQDADLHAAQAVDTQSRGAAATCNASNNPADAPQGSGAHPTAPLQQAARSLGQMPDHNTILWEPLVVRVTQSCLPCLLLDMQIAASLSCSQLVSADVLHKHRVACCVLYKLMMCAVCSNAGAEGNASMCR